MKRKVVTMTIEGVIEVDPWDAYKESRRDGIYLDGEEGSLKELLSIYNGRRVLITIEELEDE